MHARNAFTLIELLIVVGVIAILSIVIVLIINPAQLLAQNRDANRLSDMASLNSAISIYSAQNSASLGSSSITYVSIPDPLATSSIGDQCQGLGLASLPGVYSYHCPASSTYRNVNGTGWMPLNLAGLPGGSPLGQLPIDPLNTSSSRNYYTYTTNGSQFEVTANMESLKYKLGGSDDKIGSDGGTLASVYERGTLLGLEPLDYGDPSLVADWTLNEGTNTLAYDYSGNNSTGTWNGNQAGTNGYYSAGRMGGWAGYFDGGTNYINIGAPSTLNSLQVPMTITAWAEDNAGSNGDGAIITQYQGVSGNNLIHILGYNLSEFAYYASTASGGFQRIPYASIPSLNQWHLLSAVINGTISNPTLMLGVDGVEQSFTMAALSATPNTSVPIEIGGNAIGSRHEGLIGEIRIYNRALSASEISAIYNGGK
jgi:prepilin-type N-terminal cleavage/methylation domain-containing protein